MGDVIGTLLIVFLAFCGISLVVMAALIGFVVYQLRQVWRTRTEDIGAIYARYRQRNPQANEREILEHIIRQQARRCGVIGIFTSVGGFLTMALALPIDLYLTSRIQTNMAQFIARHYGHELNIGDPALAEVRDNLSMTMEAQVARGRRRASREAVELVAKKVISKFIPFFGAFLGYSFNYREAKETGQTVLKHFARSRQYVSAAR
jgi:hypothetical protein